ncbi:MAG: Gfo/Idh/MocA family protein [Sedimentisphaeraceae bacterium JB056]
MKIGILGTGSISSLHASACNNIGFPIVAVCDINKDNFLKRKDLYGEAVFYDDMGEFLADDNIEAVIVCTPNRTHYNVVKRVMQSGKHIFGEKTFTDNLEDSQKLAQLLEGYSANFQIGYMKRFFPATQKAVELLPQIGDVITAYIRSYQTGGWDADIYNSDAWKPLDGQPSRINKSMGAGMLNMAGSHVLDLMHLFFGVPESVYTLNWKPADYDVELHSNSIFKMETGVCVHFEAALAPYSSTGIHKDGWDEKIEINGTKGKLELYYVTWNKPMDNAPLLKFYSEETKSWTTFTFPKTNPFEKQLLSFEKDCINGEKSTPGSNEGLVVDKLISGCYRSYESKNAVIL